MIHINANKNYNKLQLHQKVCKNSRLKSQMITKLKGWKGSKRMPRC